MLAKFTVSNFKNFNSAFILDLQNTNAYEFNTDSIKNGIVNNAIIYGHNGVGKTNLGLALFDILGHLPENLEEYHYSHYLNALSKANISSFKYEFLFDENTVHYEYKKKDVKTIIAERISINGKELAKIDRQISNEAEINIKGAETLKRKLDNDNLSLLRYIKNNTELDKNSENEVLLTFFRFVDSMLFFRSLDDNIYLGIEVGTNDMAADIIEKENVNDLEEFLNKAGIECKLKAVNEFDKKKIVFDFEGKTIPFWQIASTGTRSLVLFYYWFQRLRENTKVSFLFIDEFDAFYHHELSTLIVEELKKTGVQFILTTHNTSIMTNDLLRPDCYFLMNKNKIRSLARSTPKELREAHNIEKMYKADSFHV